MLSGLKTRAEYLRVSSAQLKYVVPSLVLQARRAHPLTEEIRYGITASRKVGGAVQRNRAKRRLRVVAQAVLPLYGLQGVDYVLIARGHVLHISFADLLAEAEKAVQNINKKV